MLEILNFIFQGFWVWLGTLLLISAITSAIVGFIAVIRGK